MNNEHHNPALSNPIIDKLIKKLGSEWKYSGWSNDTLASITRDFEDHQYMQIFVPNAIKTNEAKDEHSTYVVCTSESHMSEYKTMEDVIDAVKDGIDDYKYTVEAIERRAKSEAL
tara:strand:+ start:259 stop:603 length:345 start_codon:yes stop_codon:yes gene_type:complete